METREQFRIQHYCKKLRLNRWDTDDICKFLILDLEYSSNPTIEHNRIKTKLWKLDLLNIANEFRHYLEDEYTLFRKIKYENYGFSDEVIWEEVYKEMDKKCDAEIDRAKQVAKSASRPGCSLFIFVTVIVFFVFLFNK